MAGTRGATGRRRVVAFLAPGLLLGLLVAPAGSMAAAEVAEASPRSTPIAPQEIAPQQTAPQEATDQIIVTATSRAVSDAAITRATELAAAEVGVDITADIAREASRTTSIVRFDEALPIEEVQSIASELATADVVVRAEPDIIMRPAVTLPNDPYLNSPYNQWGLWQAPSGGVSTKAPQAWPTSRGSAVVVAVLDTGITTHPDLGANVVPGYDFISYTSVSNDGNGRDSDPSDPGDYDPPSEPYSSWHGTHVAGTIAAVTDNGIGVAGVAPSARIQPVRVLGTGGGYLSDIADAVRWSSGASVSGVPDNSTPARVINLSLGGGGACWSYMQDAINTAVGRGSVVVVAAGNSNVDAANATPANCNNVMTVAAHGSTGQRASFSNYGATVEISGPGVGIYSTLNSGATTPGSPTYGSYSGTSMATPHVAGVAALLLAADPSLTSATAMSILQSTAQPFVAGSSCIGACGAGYVDAAAALASLGSSAPTALSVTADYEALQVAWNAPVTGTPPTHYDVEYSTDSTTWTADDTTATTSATITGLNPANSYVVRVRSVTADDSSAWLTSSAVTPLARTAPAAVTGLGMVVDDSALQVSWTAPASNGGYPIAYYSVAYSSDDSTWIADDTVTGTSTLIDGLVNGTPYRVRVSAVNALGAGPSTLAGPVAPRTPSVPTAPQSFTITPGIEELALHWSAPADDGGRATMTYAIEYSSDNSSWQSIPAYGGTALTIAGLSSATSYTVRVAAINSIGTGAWASATATPLAPPPPPPPPPPAPAPPPPPPAPVITAPGAPTITEVGAYDRTIMALWLPSDDTGGDDPSEYVVELAGPEGTQTRTSPIGFAEFDGLANGAAYRVRVAATNSAGPGDFSAWSDEVTPIGLAAAPTGLTGSAFDGGVDLRWTAPDDTGGAPVDEYIVRWISDGIEVAMTTEQTAIRLETLANGTRYDFFVAAHTEAGIGQWSAPLSLTPRAAPVSAPGDVTAQRAGERLVVTWTSPVVGDPTRYVVAASLNGGPYRIKRSVLGTRVVLSVPKRTTSIAVRVLAIDSYGRGPWSEPARPRIDSRR